MMKRKRRAAYEEFVAARYPQLRRLAYGLCGNWHTAEDTVQTALAKLYVAWPRVHGQGREDAYVRRIILNASIDTSRRASRREVPGLDGFDHPTRAGLNPDDRHDLIIALAELPRMQRQAVLLRHWFGLSVAETAADLGISEGTVKSHTSRALERLSQLMSTTEGTTR
jgi:RNA polymerase sigma-70 factor (sigma-E family)